MKHWRNVRKRLNKVRDGRKASRHLARSAVKRATVLTNFDWARWSNTPPVLPS